MIILIFVLIILGFMLIIYSLSAPPATVSIAARDNEFRKKGFNLRLPFIDKIVDRLNLAAKIKNNLDAAHVKLGVVEFFSLKLLVMAAFGAGAFFALGKFDPVFIGFGLFFGYLGVDLWLKKKITDRRNMIIKLLPEMVDLLGLCVEAGLDFTTAIKWITDKIPSNPFIEELAFVSEEIKWGKVRAKALKDMARRLNIQEVNSFVQTLVQAERMGTPVSEAFAILSEDSRMQRFHRGERFAAKAPLKILIPLIFCILPVIGIVIGGPILLQFGTTKVF